MLHNGHREMTQMLGLRAVIVTRQAGRKRMQAQIVVNVSGGAQPF